MKLDFLSDLNSTGCIDWSAIFVVVIAMANKLGKQTFAGLLFR